MISFKQFLAESAHKTAIDPAEAIKLINTHCRDALANKKPIYRGMTPGSDAYILHPEASTRESANTSNYYTIILDEFLPEHGYPKRSKSVICSNDFSTAAAFGRVYALFPYDGVKIGVCAASDLWYSPDIEVGESGDSLRIQQWNKVWREYGLTADSYEEFVADIKHKMEHGDGSDGKVDEMLKDIFGSPGNVERYLKAAYSPQALGMHLATTKDVEKYGEHGKAREMWISGKCVAIDKAVWEKMQNDEHDDELAPEDD